MKKLRLDVEALWCRRSIPSPGRGRGRVPSGATTRSNQFTFCFTQQGTTCEPAYTCPECAYTLDPCPETEACP